MSIYPINPASTLIERPLTWLWPNRFPFGKLAIIDGDPGLGKSLLTLDLCSRLSTGRPFPDGSDFPGPFNVIYLSAEDAADDTVLPRLRSLGADLDRVFVQHLTDDPLAQPLRLPSHIAVLDAILAKTGARLVVIDPIVAFLDPRVHVASDSSVRQALAPLACLAEKFQCVIILIRHFNKNNRFLALYRGGGSVGFVAACRTGWLVVPDPLHPGRRVLAQAKNNCGPLQPSLAFEIAVPDSTDNTAPLLSWTPGTHPLTADQLLASLGRGPAFDTELARAADFLTGFLEDGPRLARDVWHAAEKANLSERTLKRAKKDLNIGSQKVAVERNHHSYWLLPGQDLKGTVPEESIIPSLEPWLAPLREKYPPRTPLEDEL